DAGARRLPVEDHRQDAAFQWLVGVRHAFGQANARLLPLPRLGDDGAQNRTVMIGKIKKVPGRRFYGRVHCAATFISRVDAALPISATPSRASSSESVSGGRSRTTLSPAGRTTMPA